MSIVIHCFSFTVHRLFKITTACASMNITIAVSVNCVCKNKHKFLK